MSQNYARPKVKYVSVKPKKAKHPGNQFLVDKFVEMKRLQDLRGDQSKLGFVYFKIIKSLEQYPLPILNAEQAKTLDGVGENMASKIGVFIREHYKDFIAQTESEDFENALRRDIALQQQLEEDDIEEEAARLADQAEENNNNFDAFMMALEDSEDGSTGNRNNLKRPLAESSKEGKKRLQKAKPNPSSSEEEEGGEEIGEDDNGYNSGSSQSGEVQRNNPFAIAKTSKKNYKPVEGSTAWCILIALYNWKLEKSRKLTTKKELRAYALTLRSENIFPEMDIPNWTCLKALLNNNLIEKYNISSTENISLTPEGEAMAEKFYNKRLIDAEKNQQGNEGHSNSESADSDSEEPDENCQITVNNLSNYKFKPSKARKNTAKKKLTPIKEYISEEDDDNISQVSAVIVKKPPKEEQKVSRTQSNTISSQSQKAPAASNQRSLSNISLSNENSRSGMASVESDKENIDESPYTHSIRKDRIKNFRILLIIDNRERQKNTTDEYFYDALKNQIKVRDCETTALQIGDFLWIIEIEKRKKADDLASSIVDKRYKDQMYRLHCTKLPQVFYLVEGVCTRDSIVPQSTIDSTIVSIQIAQNFKVKKTKDYNDSIRWMSSMHSYVQRLWKKKIDDLKDHEYLHLRLTYSEFDRKNKKANQVTLRDQFGLMLRNVQGAGREAVHAIVKRFKTPLNFHSELVAQGGSIEERAKFICDETRIASENGRSISQTLARRLAVIFSERKYPEDVPQTDQQQNASKKMRKNTDTEMEEEE